MYVAFTLVDHVGITRMTIGTGAGSGDGADSGSCCRFCLWGLRSWGVDSKLSCMLLFFFFFVSTICVF